jgi:hypothetical protein
MNESGEKSIFFLKKENEKVSVAACTELGGHFAVGERFDEVHDDRLLALFFIDGTRSGPGSLRLLVLQLLLLCLLLLLLLLLLHAACNR